VELEEIIPRNWVNPVRRVKAPKLSIEPIEPVALKDIRALLDICSQGFSGSSDKAMILGLLDTDARAQEFLNKKP